MPTDQVEPSGRGDSPAPAREVSRFHLYGLRFVFLLMALFLLSTSGLRLADPPPTMMTGVGRALFAALGLLAALGIRYPLRMLPVMLFELAWKALWLLFIGLPLWFAGRLDPANADTFFAAAVGVVMVLIVMPWGHVYQNYVRRPGDRWR